MVLIILWHIWKARNAMIFNADDIVVVGVLRLIAKDIDLWACRYKNQLVLAWRDYVLNCCNM